VRFPGRQQAPEFKLNTRFIWCRTLWHQLTVSVPWTRDKSRQSVLLSLVRGAGQAVVIDLTSLTLPELIAFRETVAIATEVAEPIVRRLDLDAAEGFTDDGDDSNNRLYRPLPTVAVRKRALAEYDQGVLDRRTNALSGAGIDLVPGTRTSFVNSTMDESDQKGEVSEDASSPTDSSPGALLLSRIGPPAPKIQPPESREVGSASTPESS
jgi:hypothetical protein